MHCVPSSNVRELDMHTELHLQFQTATAESPAARQYRTDRNRLSPLFVKRVSEPGLYHDGGGLYLQVTENRSKDGAEAGPNKSWVFRFRLQGRLRSMGIGSTKDFSLADARERATKSRQLVADKIDPIEERNERASALAESQSREITFEKCARTYHEREAPMWKNPKHAQQWINTLDTYAFPAFGNKRVGQVRKSDILKALEPIWRKKPETARRVKQRIQTVLTWAAAKDYYPGYDHGMWAQIATDLGKAGDKAKHHAACPYRLVGEVIQKVKDSDSADIVKLAFEFAVLNASRSGEVRFMPWSEIATDDIWTIPGERMKAGKEHRVPLSTRSRAILNEAKKITGHHVLVFCHPETGKPFSDAVFTSLLRKGVKQPYTMHGFRSSFRDWGSEATAHPRELLEVSLAHLAKGSTEAAYWRSDVIEKRSFILSDWATFLALSSD